MSCENFIQCNSALQRRSFKLLIDNKADQNDSLLHNDVQWLSKGNMLVCFVRMITAIFRQMVCNCNFSKWCGRFLRLVFF